MGFKTPMTEPEEVKEKRRNYVCTNSKEVNPLILFSFLSDTGNQTCDLHPSQCISFLR